MDADNVYAFAMKQSRYKFQVDLRQQRKNKVF